MPPLLSLRSASVALGAEPLFADVSLSVGRGDRICLVGRNGSGKSTLLKTLAGLIEPDAGERFLQPGATVAYLPQEPELPPDATARDVVAAGVPPDQDPGRAKAAAEVALERFGLAPDAPVARLSGGERRRVDLAKVVVGDPEILLLDEPTNHLDITTIEQLERELEDFRGGLVVISHDRAFLRALSRRTWWLDRGRVRVLDQGFAAFDAWSEEVLANERAELDKLDRTIAEETHWSRHGITARRKRNQGRLRRLEALREERRARMAPQGRVRLEATTAGHGGRMVIDAEHVSKRLGGRALVEDFSTRILKGDRIGIVGPNGAGKTTLLRLLTGELAPDAGRVRLGTNLEVAYVDQRREQLDPEATPWQTLCPEGGDHVRVQGSWRHVIGYLGDFLFRPDQARSPIRALSGGERNRLLLARQLARPCHLMVLDEPTNDLDMDTLDLLQEVLDDFAGTLLLVSHDRDFLDRLVTSVIAFEGEGRLVEYAGGYSDMLRQRSPAPASKPAKARPPKAEQPPRAGGPKRPQRELERTLARIEALENEIRELEQALADPDLYVRDPEDFQARSERLESRRAELAAAEERWLELERLIEAQG